MADGCYLVASQQLGETVVEFAQKVLRNAAAYRHVANPLVGWWYKTEKAARAAQTVEALEAVDLTPPGG